MVQNNDHWRQKMTAGEFALCAKMLVKLIPVQMPSTTSSGSINGGHGEEVWHLTEHGFLPGRVILHAQVPGRVNLANVFFDITRS